MSLPKCRDSSLSAHGSSDSEDTMVEEDSDGQTSSGESTSSEEDEEAEWYYSVGEGENEAATTRNPSPQLTQDHPASQTQTSTSTWRNGATVEETSQLINHTTRIVWEDLPGSPRTPAAGPAADASHPVASVSGASGSAPMLARRRPRSPSVEIIATNLGTRHASRRDDTERTRKRRQQEYIRRALEDEGLVCTGFRIP